MGIGSKLYSCCVQFSRNYHGGVGCIQQTHKCKLLIVGGGTGGCSVAWRMSRLLPDISIVVLEPSAVHYYQPLFTLVAAGIKKIPEAQKWTKQVLPSNVIWIKDRASEFDACGNEVITRSGNKIMYDYMVVALGLVNDYDAIPGLQTGLCSCSSVSTIYSPEYCVKTDSMIQQFKGGHAVFTYPKRGGKCSGAAQKIMYLAEHHWRKRKIPYSISYMTGSEHIFGVPKYASALSKIAAERNIAVNTQMELMEIGKQHANFNYGDGQTLSVPYNFMHIAPPMSPPKCLSDCPPLADCNGYLNVDHYTLRHNKYDNVYGVGDCLCTPNSKTAAAISEQSVVVAENLTNTMCGKEPTAKYSGYGACPMLTSYKTGILAEFLYDKRVRETFPFDQSKERRIFYHLNKDVLPSLYWNKLIKGKWNGPARLRKVMNPFGK